MRVKLRVFARTRKTKFRKFVFIHLRLAPLTSNRPFLLATLVVLDEHLVEAEVKQVFRDAHRTLRVLLNELPCWLLEKLVNLLQSFVLGLRHEEDLIEPPEYGNSTVEAKRQTSPGHGVLHSGEVVRDDEGREEQPTGRSGHTIRTEVGRIHFRGDNPRERSIRTEEELVEDKTSEVDAELCGECVELVANADENETKEESRQHSDSPEASSAGLHKEDRRNGTDEEGSTTHERHVCGIVRIEPNLVHENAHVVHDSVDSRELTKEDHYVGVDDSATSTRFGKEIHPGELVGPTGIDFPLFFLGANLHNEEFLTGFVSLDSTNTLPHLEGLESLAFVHQVSWGFRHEKDTNSHNGAEDERASQNITPAAVHGDEHGSNSVPENLTKSDHELV